MIALRRLLLSNWEPAEAHLVLSERGIIAMNRIPSTTIWNKYEIGSGPRFTPPPERVRNSHNPAFSRGKVPIQAAGGHLPLIQEDQLAQQIPGSNMAIAPNSVQSSASDCPADCKNQSPPEQISASRPQPAATVGICAQHFLVIFWADTPCRRRPARTWTAPTGPNGRIRPPHTRTRPLKGCCATQGTTRCRQAQ